MDFDKLNCHDFMALAEHMDDLRIDILFGFDEAGVEPLAQQHFMAALSALAIAEANFKIAHIHQMRGEVTK